jgi:predicted DNA-binding transcriptional regulator AlpA
VATAPKLATGQPSQAARLDPADILTPEQLAQRLQVSKSWVFEQTRNRAKVRSRNPLPCIRLGKYIRFSWIAVCEWMAQNNG